MVTASKRCTPSSRIAWKTSRTPPSPASPWTPRRPVGAVLINGGAAYTNLYPVSLTLAATGASQMRFSNNGVFDGVSWENYAASKAWILDTNGNDGLRTVYVQFKDEMGNISTVSDSINLDTLPPTGSILINDGAIYTSTVGVTLSVSSTGASQMCFSNDNSHLERVGTLRHQQALDPPRRRRQQDGLLPIQG